MSVKQVENLRKNWSSSSRRQLKTFCLLLWSDTTELHETFGSIGHRLCSYMTNILHTTRSEMLVSGIFTAIINNE